MSLRLALIDDCQNDLNNLFSLINKFAKENDWTSFNYSIDRFDKPLEFLTNYKPIYDAVFLDIMMPSINGMEVAQKIREIDKNVELVFITNASEYAVKGYSVEALDFVVKPINYDALKNCLDNLVKRIKKKGKVTIIKTANGLEQVKVDAIHYIQAFGHQVVYYTDDGEKEAWNSLNKVEKELPPNIFIKVNRYTLLNIRYVKSFKKNEIIGLNNERFLVSRLNKDEIFEAIINYFRGA